MLLLLNEIDLTFEFTLNFLDDPTRDSMQGRLDMCMAVFVSRPSILTLVSALVLVYVAVFVSRPSILTLASALVPMPVYVPAHLLAVALNLALFVPSLFLFMTVV